MARNTRVVPRTARISVDVTPAERAHWQAQATAQDVPITQVIRQALRARFGEPEEKK